MPLIVRLQPNFVNRLCGRIQKAGPGQIRNVGLLFGIAGERFVIVQAFKSLAASDRDGAELLDEGQLEQSLKQAIEAAQSDPEVSVLNLIGWFSLQETEGLQANDLRFHNAHFQKPNDLALILKREGENHLLLEFYTRGTDGVLSENEHSWGALRLPMDVPAAGPIEIAMRTEAESEELNTSQIRTPMPSADALDRALAREDRKTRAGRRIRVSLFGAARKRIESDKPSAGDAVPATAATGASNISAEPAVVRTRSIVSRDGQPGPNPLVRVRAGQAPTVPAVWTGPTQQRRLSWVWPAVLCVLAASVTFAALLLRGLASGNAPAFLRTVLPDSGLRLRVEGQGDRLLLSWNRNSPVVRSANEGVLHIDDGPQHRDVRLDMGEVENGLVLYRPASGDVTFRLEVRGQQGASTSESIRVLDASKDTPLDLSAQPQPSQDVANYLGHIIRTMPAAPDKASKTHATEAGTRPTAEHKPENLASAKNSRGETLATGTWHVDKPVKSSNTPAVAARTEPEPAPPVLVSSNPTTPKPNATSTVPPVSQPAPESEAISPATAPVPSATQESHGTPSEQNTPSPSALADADFPQVNPPAASNVAKPANAQQAPTPTRNSNSAPAVKSQLPSTAPPTNALPNALPSDFVPARAVLQVLPDTRAISAAVLQAYRQVEVMVHVDASGHVKTAHIITQNKKVAESLAGAAIVAARRWTFQPATLHGRAIESDHTIVFQFRRASE